MNINKETIITICGVEFSYPSTNGSPPLRVLHNLSLDVKKGEFLSILGPSGCGKSTFLKICGGLLRPESGEIDINGKTPGQARKGRELGFVFQNPVLLKWRTVMKNIQLPCEIIKSCGTVNRAQELIDLVGLTGFENTLPKELSGGMQSRAAIARSLIYDPVLLLMDEPFGDLDEFTRDRMNIELLRIWRDTKKTVIFVTHSISEAVFLGNRVAIMSPRPSRFKEVIDINIPRPRNLSIKETEKFINYTKILREKLEIEF